MSRITAPTWPVAPTMPTFMAGPGADGVAHRGHRPVPPYTTASTWSESRSNAVCAAATAASTWSSSTTTEIRISEVEIIWMLTPAEASAAKNFAVMPGWERMPAPTMETLPIWSS